MALQDKIETIVNTLYPTATFFFSSDFRAEDDGYSLSESEYPLIILDNELAKVNTIKENANVLSKVKISMKFLNVDKWDSTDESSDVVVQAMEVIANAVYLNIYQLNEIRKDGSDPSYRILPLIRSSSAILSGVAAVAEWNENLILRWCKVPVAVL